MSSPLFPTLHRPGIAGERSVSMVAGKREIWSSTACSLVGMFSFSNCALMTGAGPAALIYWLLGLVTFLLPATVIVSVLKLYFPYESSLVQVFGSVLGARVGLFVRSCRWWCGVIGMICSSNTIASLFKEVLPPGRGAPSWQQGVIALVVLGCVGICALRPLRLHTALLKGGCLVYGALLLVPGLAGLLWIAMGHTSQTDFSFHVQTWLPTSANSPFYGVALLSTYGWEEATWTSQQASGRRSTPLQLFCATSLGILCSCLATVGMLILVPVDHQGRVSALAESIQRSLGLTGVGLVCVIILLLLFLFVGTTWTREQQAGYGHTVPKSQTSRSRQRDVRLLLQTGFAFILTLGICVGLPSFCQGLPGTPLLVIVYTVLKAILAIVWCLVMWCLFLSYLTVSGRIPEKTYRTFFCPKWVVDSCAWLGLCASTLGIITSLSHSWLPGIQDVSWTVWVGVPVLCLVVSSWLIALGRSLRERRSSLQKKLLPA